ncbi:sensor histidine kinase [Paenibacillus sp. MBLB4367]|uniref:sensor histidine kinase n=1 Tax=Paenibacillus sp. MBLB4367 TaxID=3384767 RepID=UPI003908349E
MGWFILFFPLSFAYLIMTKQLYDIDIVVRRIVFSVAIAIVPSLVITGIVKVLTLDDPNLTWDRFLFFFVAATVIMAFSIYSFEYFTTKLMPVLFPRKHMLQTSIKQIAKKLGFVSSFREIKDIVLVDIVQTLEVFGGAVVFKYKDMMEIISEGDIDTAKVEELVKAGTPDHPDFTCFEIIRHDEYTCYLIMTMKRTNTLLGAEELQWLNMIISYLAVSLENIYLIRELMMKLQQMASQLQDEKVAKEFAWFRKLSFELQEKERQRIAADLHDSTMQDLFFLKRRLRSFVDKHGLTDEAVMQMNGFIEYIETINMTLRESCFELHPYLLKEIGLVQTVRKFVERESYSSSSGLHLQTGQEKRIEALPMETKKHLFRIVQELITNAKKHAEASSVRILLTASEEGLLLSYEDDGVGFDESRMKAKDIGSGGMGMDQIRSRIFHLNGRMKLATSPGNGLRIRIELPLAETSFGKAFESGA